MTNSEHINKTDQEMRMWCVEKAIAAGANSETIKEVSEKLFSFVSPPPIISDKTDSAARAKAGFVDDIPRSGHMSYEVAKVLKKCIEWDMAGKKINQQAVGKELKMAPQLLVRAIDTLTQKKYLEKVEGSRTILIRMNPLSEPYTCQQMYLAASRGPNAKTKGKVEFNAQENKSYKLKNVATIEGGLSERQLLLARCRKAGMSEGSILNKSARVLREMLEKKHYVMPVNGANGQHHYAAE